MAEETAFGLSFGDPRKYMGKSPLADVGQALKTFLTVGALEGSGAIGVLDRMGIKPTNEGGFKFNRSTPVAGAAVPAAPGTQGTSVAMGGGFGPTAFAKEPAVPPVTSAAPMASSATPPAAMGAQPSMPTIDLGPPPNVGHDVLDDKWEGADAEPIQRQDFNPLAPDTSNQMAVSGNDYQQIQGYGKLNKAFQAFAGMA